MKNKAYNILKDYAINDTKNPRMSNFWRGWNRLFLHRAELSENLYNEILTHKDVNYISVYDARCHAKLPVIEILGYRFLLEKSIYLPKNVKEIITVNVFDKLANYSEEKKVYLEKK